MSAVGWSLRRRTANRFALFATLYLTLVGAGVVAVYRAVLANELDEEVLEQLDELRARYAMTEGGPAEFARLTAPAIREDAETPMVWMAEDLARGERFGPLGAVALSPWLAGEGPPNGDVLRPSATLRRGRAELAPGFVAHVVLDGTDWIRRATLMAGIVAGIVALGSALSLVAGQLFGRHVATWLERVAREVAGASERDADVEVLGAPDEVRAVVDALRTTLRATREETERARLLTAGLAHDLRAPVQALLTSTQVALLTPSDHERQRRALEAQQCELRALARTIDNLVVWGSPRSLGAPPRIRFDLARELEPRLAAEREEAAKAEVFLDLEREGDVTLDGDPVSLVLAVRNLVSNAIAWSPSGGQVLIRLVGRDTSIEVTVEDEGPGVPPDERQRIFEPFVRGHAAPGKRVGYGLGLAIVAFVVARADGEAWVEEGLGGGARFVVELPLG